MRATAFMVVLSIILLSAPTLADVPGLINYQGTLVDSTGVAMDTTVSITFSIYADSTAKTPVWTETQGSVEVSGGLFNVLLGQVNAIADTIFNNPSRWLGVKVESEPELKPRQRIASVGYAFKAAEADTSGYALNVPVGSDGDWTISGNSMYAAVSGSVGIGTTNPNAKLQIVDSNQFPVELRSTYSGPVGGMILRHEKSDGKPMISWQNNSGSIGYTLWNPTRDAFYVGGGLTIYGNVGIGHEEPQQLGGVPGDGIYVTQQDGGMIRYEFHRKHSALMDGLEIGSMTWYGDYYTPDDIAQIGVFVEGIDEDAADMTFSTQPVGGSLSERMRITSSGNIGIGYQDPDTTKLAVNGWVGIGTNNALQALHVVGHIYTQGDMYCTGKLSSEGGNDPPYVLYNNETRKSIMERVAEEVSEDKLDGAVLFWHGDELRFEVYLPERGEFRDLQGHLLAEVPQLHAAQ